MNFSKTINCLGHIYVQKKNISCNDFWEVENVKILKDGKSDNWTIGQMDRRRMQIFHASRWQCNTTFLCRRFIGSWCHLKLFGVNMVSLTCFVSLNSTHQYNFSCCYIFVRSICLMSLKHYHENVCVGVYSSKLISKYLRVQFGTVSFHIPSFIHITAWCSLSRAHSKPTSHL